MFDFKVIGCGPTATYCAARLAKLGYDIQIVGVKPHLGEKLCGGGLTLKSITKIKEIHSGLDNIVDYVKKFEIVNPSSYEKIDFKWGLNWLGLVKRKEFDQWMLDKAVDAGANYLELKTNDISGADFYIIADGANSEMGKKIHGPIPNHHIVVATEAYIPNNTDAFASVVLNPTFDPDNGGYSWLFARKDRVGIGTGVVRNYDKYINYYRNLIIKIAKDVYKYDVKPSDFRSWIIPIYEPREAVKGNIACIGDALGVADPIYAEGISAGLISADILVNSFQENKNFSRFTHDLNNHEYFQQMYWMNFLQKQANSNYELAFNLLKQKGVVDGFIRFINWQQLPEEFVRWVQIHYPVHALRLAYNVWKNKGKEK